MNKCQYIQYNNKSSNCFWLKPNMLTFFNRIWWSSLSKSYWRSMSIMPVDFHVSNPLNIWLDKWTKHVFTKYLLLKPDWQSEYQNQNSFIFSRRSISWLFTDLSITLDIKDRSQTGLWFFGFVFLSFLNIGLTFVALQPSGDMNLMTCSQFEI